MKPLAGSVSGIPFSIFTHNRNISKRHLDLTGGWILARFNGGWVKIHRKAILGDIGSNYIRSGLFMALIAIANLRPSTISWKGQPRKLERGELVTSFQELAELGECDRKSVMRHLNYLVQRDTIIVEKSFGGIFVKILNFDKYQTLDAEGSQVSPISGDGDRDSDVPNEGTHIEERKKERKKELKKSAFDFELAYSKYPIRQKGPKAQDRFNAFIKTHIDFDDLLKALDHYNQHLQKNAWRHPKGNFATFLGSDRTGQFWRDWIDPEAIGGGFSQESEYEKWAASKRNESERRIG